MITLTVIPLSSSRLLPLPAYDSADFRGDAERAAALVRGEVESALRALDLVGRMIPPGGAAEGDELAEDLDALIDTTCAAAMVVRGRLRARSPGWIDLTDRIRVIRRAWDFALGNDPSAAGDAKRPGGTLSGGL